MCSYDCEHLYDTAGGKYYCDVVGHLVDPENDDDYCEEE